MRELTISSSSGDCRAVIFTEGDELYTDMLEHVRAAHTSVRLECYIFGNDGIGGEFAEALMERARAGVRVQLHLDAFGSLPFAMSEWPGQLREAGVELRWFNPWRITRLLSLNRRNHRKLLVVDDEKAWLGGFNLHEESSRRYHDVQCWRDTHLRMDGRLASEAAEFFDRLWRGERRWQPATPDESGTYLVSNQNLRQLHRFRRLLKLRMRNARRRIWLTTPYFMPDHATQKAMAEAARRGIDVRLLTPFKTDQRIAQWAARAAYAKLLEAGARIYEYRPRILHAKTAVIDDDWCTIGTANLNYRSFFVNYELNLISDCKALAMALAEIFEQDLEDSREVTERAWKRRGWTWRATELIGWLARRYL